MNGIENEITLGYDDMEIPQWIENYEIKIKQGEIEK